MPREREMVALFQDDDDVHLLTDFTKSGFAFAPFDNRHKTVLLQRDRRLVATLERAEAFVRPPARVAVDSGAKRGHMELVERAIAQIRNSALEKVVLSRTVELDCTIAPVEVFKRLLGSYSNAFCYLWYHPKVGTWLGATPEILMKSENLRLTTMSLAGTKKMEETAEAWGAKEIEEQQLVTDYIMNALQDKVSDLQVSDRETIRAGQLLHLRTKLVARYERGALGQIVGALHPTPAVCGMPLALSKEFITNNEAYDRAYYTGYLGELNAQVDRARSARKANQENQAYRTVKTETTFFVNLRCMQIRAGKAILYVGGGVTKDSDPESEWEETVAKTQTMLQVLTSD